MWAIPGRSSDAAIVTGGPSPATYVRPPSSRKSTYSTYTASPCGRRRPLGQAGFASAAWLGAGLALPAPAGPSGGEMVAAASATPAPLARGANTPSKVTPPPPPPPVPQEDQCASRI